MICNHDCFHCRFHDCMAPSNDSMTPWESAVLHGAMGKWERDMIDRQVSRMISAGYGWAEISRTLDISASDINNATIRIKRAAKRLQPA